MILIMFEDKVLHFNLENAVEFTESIVHSNLEFFKYKGKNKASPSTHFDWLVCYTGLVSNG